MKLALNFGFGLLDCLNYADWRLWSLVSIWSCKVFRHGCSGLETNLFINFTKALWWIQEPRNVLYFALFCEHLEGNFYVGSSWSLSIYFVFRFQIKFSGNCRADLMASFRVRQSETAPTWLLSLCLPTNCFPPPPTNFNSNSPQKFVFGFTKAKHVKNWSKVWWAKWNYDMCVFVANNWRDLDFKMCHTSCLIIPS